MRLLGKAFFIFVFFTGQALAEVASYEQVTRYMRLSGITEMIKSMPSMLDTMVEQELSVMQNPEQDQQFSKKLINAWDVQALNDLMIKDIQSRLTKQQMNQLLERQQSPLFKKITQAEMVAYATDFQQQMTVYINHLQMNPPAAETTAAIQFLVTSTQMTERVMDMVVEIERALMVLLSGGSDQTMSVLEKEMAATRPTKFDMEQHSMLMSYFLYRDFSNEEIRQYAEMFDSELGRLELEVQSESIIQAIKSLIGKLSDGLEAE